MSNFKLGYAWLQTLATATANLTASTTRVLANLFSGSRSDRFELATASTDILTVNYDLGASTTKTANFLAIMRAKLLHRNDCTGVRLRGSTQSATLPSTLTPTAHFDPNRGVTTVSGAVSQWNDLSGNGYNATQGTAANRPLLSRADNQENYLAYSHDQSNAVYASEQLTSVTANSVLDSDGLLEGTTILANTAAARHSRYQNVVGSARPTNTAVVSSVEVKKSNHRYIWFGDRSHSSWHGVCFDFDTATLGTQANLTSAVVTALSNSWYRITIGYNVSDTGSCSVAVYFNTTNASTSPISHTPAGTEEIYLAKFAWRTSGADNTYLRNTNSYALAKGINGNRALVFDGSNDTFTNTLTVNPTGGMWASFAVRVNTTTAIDHGVISSIGAAQRLRVFINAGGGITVRVMNGGAAYIGRTAPASTIVAGTTAIVTFTYDGGTAASGIKIYKNGVQVDTADSNSGAYTVPTAGAVLVIGELSAGDRLNGFLGDLIFVQGATLSAGNLTAITEQLTSKYITSPIVQLDSLSTQTLMGPNDEDYFTVFTESSAFRHWWLELVNEGTASKYPCSKVLFGKALDFGREPQLPISIDQSRQAPWSREAGLSTTINLGPISDTNKETFLNEVVKNSDVMPVVALDPAAYVFNDTKGMHCKIANHDVQPYFGADNDISITLEEEI